MDSTIVAAASMVIRTFPWCDEDTPFFVVLSIEGLVGDRSFSGNGAYGGSDRADVKRFGRALPALMIKKAHVAIAATVA